MIPIASMKVCSKLFAPLLLCAAAQPLAATQETFDNPQSFASELRQLRHALERTGAKDALKSLPDDWKVQTPEASYSISTRPFRQGSFAEAKAGIDMLVAEAEQYGRAAPVSGSPRLILRRILARPEFERDRTISPWESIQARIAKWFNDLIRRFLGLAARNPAVSNGFFWVVLLAACGTIVSFLYRLTKRSTGRAQVETNPNALSQIRWQHLITDAQNAAEAGRVREAIQIAYWCAIAKLQHAGILPRMSPHTPREYLELMAAGQSTKARTAREPLRALTGQLEQFWYARAEAAPEDFAHSLKLLDEIG